MKKIIPAFFGLIMLCFQSGCKTEINTRDPQASRDIQSSIKDNLFLCKFDLSGNNNTLHTKEAWTEYVWYNQIYNGKIEKVKNGMLQINLKIEKLLNSKISSGSYESKWILEDQFENALSQSGDVYTLSIPRGISMDSIPIFIWELKDGKKTNKLGELYLKKA